LLTNMCKLAAEESGSQTKVLFATCAACHGNQGQGNEQLHAPVLAGLSSDYLVRQLNHFKAKTRGGQNTDVLGAQMMAVTSALSVEQINDLANYIESLAPEAQQVLLEANVKRGQGLYNGSCGACHGSAGEGNKSLHTPRLINQSVDYLTRQILAFQTGQRAYSSDDKYGKQMAMMAKSIQSEKDLTDILAYLQAKNKAD
jgi:cytochrome c553